MIFEIISGGGKTDWVGKEWAGLFFPRGKNGPAHSFPGEKTDWGEIPACYTGHMLGAIELPSSGASQKKFFNGRYPMRRLLGPTLWKFVAQSIHNSQGAEFN